MKIFEATMSLDFTPIDWKSKRRIQPEDSPAAWPLTRPDFGELSRVV